MVPVDTGDDDADLVGALVVAADCDVNSKMLATVVLTVTAAGAVPLGPLITFAVAVTPVGGATAGVITLDGPGTDGVITIATDAPLGAVTNWLAHAINTAGTAFSAVAQGERLFVSAQAAAMPFSP